jgi:hypothetical protein
MSWQRPNGERVGGMPSKMTVHQLRRWIPLPGRDPRMAFCAGQRRGPIEVNHGHEGHRVDQRRRQGFQTSA